MAHMTTADLLASGEPLFRVTEAARQLGLSISPRTGIRWGLRGRGRGTTPLPTIKVGGARQTTVGALRRWLAETEQPGRPVDVADPVDAESILATHGLARRQLKEGGDA